MSGDFGVNQGLVEEQFIRWAENPASVDEAWRDYFDSLPPEQWPQLTSAGSIIAPLKTISGDYAQPTDDHDNGAPARAELVGIRTGGIGVDPGHRYLPPFETIASASFLIHRPI